MELAEQSPTSSAADVNKLSCAIPIPKSPQEQLPCSPHDAYVVGAGGSAQPVSAAARPEGMVCDGEGSLVRTADCHGEIDATNTDGNK
jgi:hypothetical protein